MTKETKVGLLIGLGIILLIGIVVSDHLSKSKEQDPAPLSNWAPQVSESINPGGDPFANQPVPTSSGQRNGPIPLPDELQAPQRRVQPTSPSTQSPQQRRSSVQDATASSQGFGPRQYIEPERIEQPDANRRMALGQSQTSSNFPPPASRIVTEQLNNAGVRNDRLKPLLHYVQPGETLYQIANTYYGSDDYWVVIRNANPKLITKDGQIQSGTRLSIPPDKGLHLPSQTSQPITTVTAIQPREKMITVKTGDTLSGLASEYLGGASRWPELLKANRDQLRTPEQLREGMKLRIPRQQTVAPNTTTTITTTQTRTPQPAKYTVRSGDTLSSIAGQLLGSQRNWDKLYEANRRILKSPDDLQVGMELKIP